MFFCVDEWVQTKMTNSFFGEGEKQRERQTERETERNRNRERERERERERVCVWKREREIITTTPHIHEYDPHTYTHSYMKQMHTFHNSIHICAHKQEYRTWWKHGPIVWPHHERVNKVHITPRHRGGGYPERQNSVKCKSLWFFFLFFFLPKS